MESLNIPNIKMKKANSIQYTYRRLRKIAALFRFFELFLFIMVVSRFTTQLPLAFRISADYFTGISLSLFTTPTPGSVFLIGNAIVLLLFLISRDHATFSSSSAAAGDKKITNLDYYDDYVKRNHKISNFHQHKQTTTIIKDQTGGVINEIAPAAEIKERKKIERSQSDNIIVLNRQKPVGRLTRTLTSETCRKVPSLEDDDEMSNEEFQQKVEDFIARQQREFFGC
ncbi:uncharacterized protein LOC124924816 [Impatiens glandulifera]|uniref:uncharacterized protein LOC124924816 n=1 Tax=Impatiens glandulifera TaxID=253017 RepID=UPI001FB15AFB|nr:uncharacterized protein LOC124924816 [Impatiens glandulifera]